jgi:hypothetical protein
MSLARLTKTPGDILDYTVDYSVWLGSDVIDSSDWEVPPALTITTDSFDNTTTTVWLSGGQVGQEYKAKNTITTVGGRTKVTSFDLKMVDE